MKIRNGLILRHVMDTDIVIDVSGSFSGVMKLNATSLEIWNGVAAGKSAQEIALSLTERYEVTEESALADVERFCGDMAKQGFFEA